MSNPLFVLFTASGVTVLAAGLVYSLTKALKSSTTNGSATNGQQAPLRLRPMTRLLKEEDFAFLSSQPGYKPEIAAQLRSRRVTIFRSYLRQLATEFDNLHRSLRVLVLHAGEDRPGIGRVLIEQRVLFTLRVAQVRTRLWMFQMGWKPLDASQLVDGVETLRAQVAQLSESLAGQPGSVQPMTA